jgi:hypothetical protein
MWLLSSISKFLLLVAGAVLGTGMIHHDVHDILIKHHCCLLEEIFIVFCFDAFC